MDEYLSEKEQIELIKQWWRDNGWYLVGGAVLAGLGYLGYFQYQAWQDRVAEEAAAIYESLRLELEDDDREGADALLEELETDYAGSPYLDQARFLIAEDNLIRDTDRAIAELEAVAAQTENEALAKVARLRLARVLAYDEQLEAALATLNVPDAGEFEGRYSEVRGDIHAALGDDEAAINAYTEALLGAANGSINRESVQLKLNDLIQSQQADSGDEG